MANSRMKLELLLKGIDQLSGVVKKQSPLLKNLDRDATKAYNSLKKLFSLSGKKLNFGNQFSAELRKSNTDAAKLKKTLEAVGKIKIKSPKIDFSGSDVSPRFNRKQGQRELDRLFGRNQRSRNYVERLANLDERLIQPISQTKNVWREQMDSLRPYIEETKKLYRAQETFKLFDLSETGNKKAFDAVRRVVKEIKGASLSDATEDITDLFNALGNVSSATAALPFTTKYRTNFTALYGDKFSDKEIGQQIQSSFKVAEMIGATIKGQAETERVVDVLSKISNSTGGRVTGADFHAMMKTGKTSTKSLSTTGMMNISSLIEEMGAGNVGTSMMSMFQALVAGTMKQSAKERFHHFGLIDEDKIEYGKGQRIKNLKPGANKLGALMQEDPLKAADMLREAMRKKGVNVDDAKAVDEELSILFQNRNANALMSQLINQREQVVKEADRANKAKGVLGMDAQLANTELKKIQEFEAAIKNFKTEAGVPLIQMGTQITSALTPFIKLAGEYPTITKFTVATMLLGKSFSGIAQTASALSGGGGIATFFNRGSSAADNATQSFRRASGELGGVSNKMSGLKALGKIGLSVVGVEAAVITIGAFAEKLKELSEQSAKLAEDSKTVRENYDRLAGLGILYNPAGDFKDRKGNDVTPEFDRQADSFLNAAKMGRELMLAFHPDKATLWERWNFSQPYGVDLSSPFKQQFDPVKAVATWRSEGLTQGLSDHNVLTRLLVKIEKGDKNKVGKDGKEIEGGLNLNLQGVELFKEALKLNATLNGDSEMFRIASENARKEVYGDKPQNAAPLNAFNQIINPSGQSSLFQKIQPTGKPDFFQPTTKTPTETPALIKGFDNISLGKAVPNFLGNLNGLAQPIAGATQTFTGLQTAGGDWQTSMLRISEGNNKGAQGLLTFGNALLATNQPLNSLVTSANSVSSGLDAVGLKLTNWQPPTPRVVAYSVGIPTDLNGKPVVSIAPPSKASGGTVKRGGLAYIHAGEDIMPADVTSRYRAPKNAGSSTPNINIEIPVNVIINGGGDIDQKTVAMLRREMRAIVKDELQPDKIASRVALAVGRASERA